MDLILFLLFVSDTILFYYAYRYFTRIKKAIEYIEENCFDLNDNTCEELEKDKLLKILRGDNDE